MQQAHECLEDAEELLSLGRGARTVINRAYYAAFYTVLALLQSKDKAPRKHEGALTLFELEFVKTGLLPKELLESLHFLSEQRHEHDYLTIDLVELAEAHETLEVASKFVQFVQSYLRFTDQT